MAKYSNANDKEWGPQYDNLAYQPELVSRIQPTWPNSGKQTLFSGDTGNEWDGVPSDYSPNPHRCKKFLIIFGIILLVIGIASGIVLAIYFSSHVEIPESTVATTVIPTTLEVQKYKGSVKLDEQYDPALADMSSPAAQNRTKEFQAKMDAIYKNSSLADAYNGTVVTGFRNGSIIVIFEIIFIVNVKKTEPAKPGIPDIKIDITIIAQILQSNTSKTVLSITAILSLNLVPPVIPTTLGATTVIPTTLGATTVIPTSLGATTVIPTSLGATTVIPTSLEVQKYMGSVKLNEQYDPALADMSSPAAQNRAKEFQAKMDAIYKNSSVADAYNGTVVTGFRNGSIIVIFEIIFIVNVKKTDPDKPGIPDINIDLNIILQILQLNTSKSILSITDILPLDLVTTTVKPPTSVTTPIANTNITPDISVSSQTISAILTTALTPREDKSSLSTIYQPGGTTIVTPHVNFTGTRVSGTSTRQTPHVNFTGTRVSGTSTRQTPHVNFTGTRVSGTSTRQTPHVNFTGTRVSGTSTRQTPHANFTGTRVSGTSTTKRPPVDFTGTTSSVVYRNTTKTTPYTWHSSSLSHTPFTGTTVMTTASPIANCGLGLSPCSSNNQCIQDNWFCDRNIDCSDESDESQIRCGWNDTKPTPEPKFPSGIELNCNFENPDRRLCNYQASNGSFTWSIQRGPTQSNSTGPSFDHSYQDETGNYIFTESSYGKFMDNASLVSDFIRTDNKTSSLSFYYHMYGPMMGSLSVYFDIRENGQMKRELQWTKSGDNGNYWMKACLSLPANTVLRTHFIARRGMLHTSDNAIDDIEYSTQPCQKLPCMFDDSMCGEVVSPSGEQSGSYKWHVQRSVTMWNKAEQMGLVGDHTMGSKFARYMMADSSNGNSNDKTMYKTPVLSTEDKASLNFRYFINGENVNKLTVNIRYNNTLESKTWFKNNEDSKSWHRGCLPVASNTGAVAEFIAFHGSGPDGMIAVDDIVLLKSQSCEKVTECEFGQDLFCSMKITENKYRWKMHDSIKGKYIEAIGENREGMKAMLTSQTFTPVSNDSITLKYFMKGSVSLYINMMEKNEKGQEVTTTLWTGNSQVTPDMLNPPPPLNINNLQLKEVKKTSEQNDQIDWMKVCVPLPSKPLAIQIVSLKRDVVKDAMALKYMEISDEECKMGLMKTNCSFKEPNMCNYDIDCSTNTQFMWHRTTGFRSKKLTGPQRDHTTNTTGGHFLQADSSKGRPQDKTKVVFQNIKVSKTSSFRFYYYMYGSDIDSLQVDINDNMVWKETGPKTLFWYMGCVDLPLNTQVNVSFIATRGMGPLGDIAIDDVSMSHIPCPPQEIECAFEDEMMCGYTGLPASQADNKVMKDDQWFRSNISLKELSIYKTTFVNDYHLLTRRPSRIRSPQMQVTSTSCLQFSYFILMGKGTNITVKAIYKDLSKTEENVFSTNNFTWAEWRSGQMNLQNGSVAIEFSVLPYDQKIMDTFFAIDNVKVIPNTCQPLVCSDVNLWKCTKGDFCIPKYKMCDKVENCEDGSDEVGCSSFSKDIRLVNGITTGNEGRLELFVQGSWGTAFGLQWIEANAHVACRQLGFTGYSKSVRFGKYHYGNGRLWKINCFGNESRIQDCDLDSVENFAPHMSDVGLICYNTTCETSKTACPKSINDTYSYCLFGDQFCDGDLDCPDGHDEKNCSAKCKNDEYYCKNKQCIPRSEYCDGTINCKDASDEINCITKDARGFVSVFHAGETLPLCIDANKTNDDIFSTICMNTAQGVLDVSLPGQSVSKGVMVTYDATAKSLFGSYRMSQISPCTQARIQCNKPECGKRASVHYNNQYVQFGTKSLPKEYPWQALLLRNGKFICGVTVYTNKWCITAEHCVVEKGVQYEVAVGITHKQNLHNAPKYKVKAIKHHPNSVIIDGIPYSDIALLLLEDEVKFSDSVQPVCLPSKVYTKHDDCYLTGWGRNENLITQTHLQEAKVTVVDNEECKKFYKIDISIICFKHDHPNMPSCYGDSGGPLVCRNSYGRFELVGVVSFGYPLCSASNGTAAAFVNVLAMRGWIVDETRCKMHCPMDNKCLYEPEICDGVSHCKNSSDEKPPYCKPSVSCKYGSPYKCGYRNVSSSPWYWTSIYHPSAAITSQPATGGDGETDEFMIANPSATKNNPALMESPDFSNVPCISFLYIAHGNSSSTQAVLNVKAKLENSGTVSSIWSNNNSSNVILKSASAHWKMAKLYLPSNTKSVMFEAYYTNPSNESFITVDDVQALGANCKQICPENFFKCNNGECIKNSYRCNKIAECSDGSDEMECMHIQG